MSTQVEISVEWTNGKGWWWATNILPGPNGSGQVGGKLVGDLSKSTSDAEIIKTVCDDSHLKAFIEHSRSFFSNQSPLYTVRIARYYDLAPGALVMGEPLHDRETPKPWGSNPGDSDVLKVDIRFGEISKEWNWSCVVDGKAYNGSFGYPHKKNDSDVFIMIIALFNYLSPEISGYGDSRPGHLYFNDKSVDVRVTRHYNVDLKGEIKQ